jgi:hypothetical protein
MINIKMNARIIGLVVLIILSILLFLFISYAELKDGVDNLISPNSSSCSSIPSGILKTMESIDEIV